VTGFRPGEPSQRVSRILLRETKPENMKTEDAVIVVGMVKYLVNKVLILQYSLDLQLLWSEQAGIEGM